MDTARFVCEAMTGDVVSVCTYTPFCLVAAATAARLDLGADDRARTAHRRRVEGEHRGA
jgi:hypothetical protein